MKRSALTLSILGLTAFAAPALAEDPTMKTEKKVETKQEMKTSVGTTEDKTAIESKTQKNADGTTTTEATKEKMHKGPGMKAHKSKMTEKTTKDASGNIVDQTKTKEMK